MKPRVVGCGAVFDADPAYRYVLWRNFVEAPVDPCLWVMLNPSVATATTDDNTVRRCQVFSRRWGFDACRVVNIFAYRSTDPRRLRVVPDPVGPLNNQHIQAEAAAASMIVVAWGNHGAERQRSAAVRVLLRPYRTWCFATTKTGEPVHPLYQPTLSSLVLFS